MKLGLLSAILAGKSFRQAVDLCAQIGFESMETACWPKQAATRRYAGVTHLDVDALTAEQLTQELDYARKKNVPVCALAYYPNPLSADESERTLAIRHICRLIDVAAETGVGLVNTFIGRDRFKTVEENLESYEQVWEPIVKKAEERARILVSDAEIVKAAQQRASEITSAAQTEARTLRQTVTDYCDNMLKNTEETMVENAAQVKNVRANLRQNAKKNG